MDFGFLTEDVLIEVGGIIGFIIAGAAGYFLPKASRAIKRRIQQKYFRSSLKKSVEIKIRLAEVKASFGASRIYLFQFHNGVVYLGDRSFHKYSMSAVFEVVNGGLSREIQNYQAMPLSKYAELVDLLIENDEDYAIIGRHETCDISIEDADMEDIFYQIGSPKGTMVFVEVHNVKKQFTGMIGFMFDSEITKDRFLRLREKSSLDQLLVELRNVI